MDAIISQLGLDNSVFTELALFAVVFFLLSRFYFKPFQKLIEARQQATVEDRRRAAEMIETAERKFEEYRDRLNQERVAVRKEFDRITDAAKKKESEILASTRLEVKKLSQETTEALEKQRKELKSKLESEVEGMARRLADGLLARKSG